MQVSKIKKLRELKKYTQAQMSKLVDIAESTYIDIEKGYNDPKVSYIEKIAQVLGVEVSFFFTPEKNYSIVEEPQETYVKCKSCATKDDAMLLMNMRLITLQENNDALLKSNKNLNKLIEELSTKK